MQNSVTLAQLPYTGFDYGEMYNSLFWVVLLIWSLVLAFIIIKNKSFFARIFSALVGIFIGGGGGGAGQAAEPVILTERVIRFDPLVDPIAAYKIRSQMSQADLDPLPTLQAPEPIDIATQERVKEIIDTELAVSRIGQTTDEFSSDDFGTVDFDGVNPDDTWQPRERIVLPQRQAYPPEQKRIGQNLTLRDDARAEKIPRQATPEKQVVKIYTDSLALDTSGEYPKVVLTREDVTNY